MIRKFDGGLRPNDKNNAMNTIEYIRMEGKEEGLAEGRSEGRAQ
jgi:hypothetical protein